MLDQGLYATGVAPCAQAMDVEWTAYSGDAVSGMATFAHWPYRVARWMGDFNRDTGTYMSKNQSAVRYRAEE